MSQRQIECNRDENSNILHINNCLSVLIAFELLLLCTSFAANAIVGGDGGGGGVFIFISRQFKILWRVYGTMCPVLWKPPKSVWSILSTIDDNNYTFLLHF